LGFKPGLARPEEKYAVKYTIPALGEHISIFGNEGIASCSLPIYEFSSSYLSEEEDEFFTCSSLFLDFSDTNLMASSTTVMLVRSSIFVV
jgi:hypothetical protein